jgi:hypothetical protein
MYRIPDSSDWVLLAINQTLTLCRHFHVIPCQVCPAFDVLGVTIPRPGNAIAAIV